MSGNKSSGIYIIDSLFNIVSFNEPMKEKYPLIRKNEKCFKALMNGAEPCTFCPVANKINGPRMYTDPVRQVKETIDAIEIPLSDGRIGYAMVFSSVLDLSEIDELTGLYTREAFFRYAQRLIDTSPDAEFDMFIVDIEAFRNVNRKYGEKVGDRVLQALADFIKTNTPDGICARLNSDLFVGIRPRQTGYGIEGTLRLTQEFIENAPVPGLVLKNGIYENIDKTLPMWYMLFIAFSAYGVMLNTFLRPSLSATTICVFLVAGPLLIIDRPIRVFTYTFALSLVFIICAVNAKSSYLAFADSVNVLCCVFLGAVIYTMLNKVKLREMSHARQLQRERDTDRLTMLLNKTAFVEKVQDRLHHTEDGALLAMDIDDFKGINDSYGHDYGDVILQRTARCIQETFQITDLCARFGGDEYVVFLPEITREELTGLMDQLMERIKQDVVLPDAGNTMGISIGAAFFNSDDHEYRDLFHCADNALYAAKKMGKNRYHVYEE